MSGREPIYSRYANHYDQIGQRRFGEISAEHLLRLLNAKGADPRTVLDLACGTGAATLAFARFGLSATGLDLSGPMLDRAKASAEVEMLPVQWTQADMTAFAVDVPFDLCTCMYDAVNYLGDLREF
jgi:ubiquinone/menaquinone biosynthesis C-methylase UbiE